jgi:hypothetical protein
MRSKQITKPWARPGAWAEKMGHAGMVTILRETRWLTSLNYLPSARFARVFLVICSYRCKGTPTCIWYWSNFPPALANTATPGLHVEKSASE